MAKDCQKGFVILNDLPAIAEKYKRMENALETLNRNGISDEIAKEALAFDPLA